MNLRTIKNKLGLKFASKLRTSRLEVEKHGSCKKKKCIFSNVRVKSTKYHIYISYKTKFPMALFLFRTRESWKKSWWNAQCWVTNLWRRRRRSVMKIMENICIMKNIGGRWTLTGISVPTALRKLLFDIGET